MSIVKWSHFCFCWNWWYGSAKVVFLHIIMKPAKIIESPLNFPNSCFRLFRSIFGTALFIFFKVLLFFCSDRSFYLICNIREFKKRIGLFFGKRFDFDTETIEELIPLSSIFVDSGEWLDFFEERRCGEFCGDYKREFSIGGRNVKWFSCPLIVLMNVLFLFRRTALLYWTILTDKCFLNFTLIFIQIYLIWRRFLWIGIVL